MADERTPLLWTRGSLNDLHDQFCALTGVPPFNRKDKQAQIEPKTLYGRATRRYAQARRSHTFMTALSNTLLLSQVVLGATLTALGASESSHILITVFGVVNTIIAGLVAYLKSRGQPARQRIFRDELERVVDEIENSEIMWRGIAQGAHGYSDIDIDDKVTVRSEVARLMRCYDKAVRNFAMSNPDNYLMGQAEGSTALRTRTGIVGPTPALLPVIPPAIPAHESTLAVPPVEDPDQSPASAPNNIVTTPKEEKKDLDIPDKAKNTADQAGPSGSGSKAPSITDAASEPETTTLRHVSIEQPPRPRSTTPVVLRRESRRVAGNGF